MIKNLPTNTRDVRNMGSIPGLGRFPWSRKWQPTPVFLPGKSHGQRSLVGYNAWGHKESDRTGQLSTPACIYYVPFILNSFSSHNNSRK